MGRVCPGSVLSLNPVLHPALNSLKTVRTKIILVDKIFKQKFIFCLAFGTFLLVPMLAQPVGEVQHRARPVLQSRKGKEHCMLLPV